MSPNPIPVAGQIALIVRQLKTSISHESPDYIGFFSGTTQRQAQIDNLNPRPVETGPRKPGIAVYG